MIRISIDVGKVSEKIQYHFMRLQGTYLNIIKANYERPRVNVVLNYRKHFLQNQEGGKGIHSLPAYSI
jgi:hypothetical protein